MSAEGDSAVAQTPLVEDDGGLAELLKGLGWDENPLESEDEDEEEEYVDSEDEGEEVGDYRGEVVDAMLQTYTWQWVDFLKDFGTSESFLIDGDALLLHVYSDAFLDNRLGGQLLHTVWLVEKFLADLAQRGSRFGVFFMRGNASFFEAISPSCHLAREVVMRHLISVLPEDVCEVFVVAGSWNHPSPSVPELNRGDDDATVEWPALLQSFIPAFVMTNIVSHRNKALALPASVPVGCFVHDCLQNRFYVVLMHNLSFVGSRVHAHLLLPRQSSDVKDMLQNEKSSGCLSVPLHTPPFPEILKDGNTAHAFAQLDICARTTVLALGELLKGGNDASDVTFSAALCVACAARKHISLPERSFSFASDDVDLVASAAGDFVSRFHAALIQALPIVFNAPCPSGESAGGMIADLYDGRLLCGVLFAAAAGDAEQLLTQQQDDTAQTMWGCLPLECDLASALSTESIVAAVPESIVDRVRGAYKAATERAEKCTTATENLPRLLSGLACGFPLLPELLGTDLHARMSAFESDSVFVGDCGVREFKNDHHYHSTQLLVEEPDYLKAGEGNDRPKPQMAGLKLSAKQRWLRQRSRMRREQKKAATAHNFSQSLLFGHPVQKMVIIDTTPETRETGKGKKSSDSLAGKVAKPGKMSKADKIRLEAEKKREQQQNQKDTIRLENLVKDWQGHPSFADKMIEFADYFKLGSPAACEARLQATDTMLKNEQLDKKKAFVQLQCILRQRPLEDLSDSRDRMRSAALRIGLSDLAHVLGKSTMPDKAKGAKKKQQSMIPGSEALPPGSASSALTFQLEVAPEELRRPAGIAGDGRVSFAPDKWQRTLLDVVDAGDSALVVAPTASGKTFLSYYVMERCLRRSHRGVVVFVAPTKALVNQVFAEINARFDKVYQSPEQRLVGVFTRDFRENELTCQILVCVPQCLQILLMSSENVAWAERVETIILDEVHSIGDTNGEIWEHIILLSKCPLIMLSATLGDVNRFKGWLEKVEKAKDRRLVTVTHGERWNDLKSWVFNPRAQGGAAITSMHSCGVIDAEADPSIPATLKLLPEECVSLFRSMYPLLSASEAAKLAPNAFFERHAERPGDAIFWDLSMRDVSAWEASLKESFAKLPREDRARILVDVSQSTVSALEGSDSIIDESQGINLPGVHRLVSEMRDREMMPAICFHMSQRGCNKLARYVSHKLQQEEKEHRNASGWAEKVRTLMARLETLRAGAAKGLVGAKEDVEDSREQMMEDIDQLEKKIEALLGADRDFTLFQGTDVLTEDEIDNALGPYAPEGYEWLRKAMLRGVAAHHAGMNKKWRMAIEDLFRRKKLVLVFATATLSMGINMPCKTSVFVGDAVYINSMSYRQMAGRAGRRGFDLRGNVIFFGMRSTKIKRLVKSHLPVLQGNQLLSSSTVLRLIMMYVKSTKWRAGAVGGRDLAKEVLWAISRCVNMPLFQPSHLTPEHTAHTFRFCFEHLCRERLLIPSYEEEQQDEDKEEGSLVVSDLAAFISHLHYTQPANFAFLSLLQSGVLSDMCKADVSDEQKELDVLLVLCHLFNRLPLASHHESLVAANKRVGPSLVMLPPLDPGVREGIESANQKVLKAFVDYQRCFASAYAEDLGVDDLLPFSRVRCGAQHPSSAALPALSCMAQRVSIRSCFVALSGHGDEGFGSVEELCGSLRRGLHVDPSMLPVFVIAKEPLNAFLYDFYKHGQLPAIVRYNGIKQEGLWELLRDFELIIRTDGHQRDARSSDAVLCPCRKGTLTVTLKGTLTVTLSWQAISAAMRFRLDNGCDWRVFQDRDVVETLERIAGSFTEKVRAIAN